MGNKNISEKKTKEQISRGDVFFNRLIIALTVALLYTFYVISIPNNLMLAYYAHLPLAIGCVLVGIMAALYAKTAKANGASYEKKTLAPAFISLLFVYTGVLFGVSFLFTNTTVAILLAFGAVALLFAYYELPRDFFYLSFYAAVATLLVALPTVVTFSGVLGTVLDVLFYALSVAISAAFMVVTAVMLKGGLSKLSAAVFPEGYSRRYPLFVMPIAILLVAALRIFSLVPLSFCGMGILILLLVFLVIYVFDNV